MIIIVRLSAISDTGAGSARRGAWEELAVGVFLTGRDSCSPRVLFRSTAADLETPEGGVVSTSSSPSLVFQLRTLFIKVLF